MNIVCTAILELNWNGKQVYKALRKVRKMATVSFRRNLAGMDQFMVIESDQSFNDPNPMFHYIFERTMELWAQGHNVLYVDADSLCVRPTEVFGKFDYFRCFSTTGDKTRFKAYFPEYFLSGVRYVPASLSRTVWDVGIGQWERFEEALKNDPVWHGHDGWDYEQFVYNQMFYSQPQVRADHQAMIRNGMNCYYKWPEIQNANIIAYNASHLDSKLPQVMRKDYRQFVMAHRTRKRSA